VVCGVDIEVPLRTADTVLEVIPQERVETLGAKMSTLALVGSQRRLRDKGVERMGRGLTQSC
jgi:hypothetical protein